MLSTVMLYSHDSSRVFDSWIQLPEESWSTKPKTSRTVHIVYRRKSTLNFFWSYKCRGNSFPVRSSISISRQQTISFGSILLKRRLWYWWLMPTESTEWSRLEIQLEGITLGQVHHVKLFGLELHEQVSFEVHIESSNGGTPLKVGVLGAKPPLKWAWP